MAVQRPQSAVIRRSIPNNDTVKHKKGDVIFSAVVQKKKKVIPKQTKRSWSSLRSETSLPGSRSPPKGRTVETTSMQFNLKPFAQPLEAVNYNIQRSPENPIGGKLIIQNRNQSKGKKMRKRPQSAVARRMTSTDKIFSSTAKTRHSMVSKPTYNKSASSMDNHNYEKHTTASFVKQRPVSARATFMNRNTRERPTTLQLFGKVKRKPSFQDYTSCLKHKVNLSDPQLSLRQKNDAISRNKQASGREHYRSDALAIELSLAENLKLLESFHEQLISAQRTGAPSQGQLQDLKENYFRIYKSAFDKVIQALPEYETLLVRIKRAYEIDLLEKLKNEEDSEDEYFDTSKIKNKEEETTKPAEINFEQINELKDQLEEMREENDMLKSRVQEKDIMIQNLTDQLSYQSKEAFVYKTKFLEINKHEPSAIEKRMRSIEMNVEEAIYGLPETTTIQREAMEIPVAVFDENKSQPLMSQATAEHIKHIESELEGLKERENTLRSMLADAGNTQVEEGELLHTPKASEETKPSLLIDPTLVDEKSFEGKEDPSPGTPHMSLKDRLLNRIRRESVGPDEIATGPSVNQNYGAFHRVPDHLKEAGQKSPPSVYNMQLNST